MPLFSIPVPRFRRRKTTLPAPGAAPGTLAVPEGHTRPVVRRTVFGPGRCETIELAPEAGEEALAPVEGATVWVDIQGLGDGSLIRRLGDLLGLHPLIVEDIVHVHQRPKVEEYTDYLFVVLRMVRLLDDQRVDNEQLSLVLKPGLLVTFQERPGDGFEPVRRRLREGKGHLQSEGADYLAYALIDAAIDAYFPVLELYGDTMDQLDDEVRDNPTPAVAGAIHQMRRELRQFRRATWPLRDLAAALGRNDYDLMGEAARVAMRDCYDHAVQVAEFVEGNRERASDLADLYTTQVSEKTNQVMKVLTIIATIFIPLTFLCGLYGMNFDPKTSPYNMPELEWRYGYIAFWVVAVLAFFGMLWFFRHKGWIGSGERRRNR